MGATGFAQVAGRPWVYKLATGEVSPGTGKRARGDLICNLLASSGSCYRVVELRPCPRIASRWAVGSVDWARDQLESPEFVASDGGSPCRVDSRISLLISGKKNPAHDSL